MKMNPLDRVLRFLGRSQFFTYSAIFHLLLVAAVGSRVLYDKIQERPDMQAILPTTDRPADSQAPPPENTASTGSEGGSAGGGMPEAGIGIVKGAGEITLAPVVSREIRISVGDPGLAQPIRKMPGTPLPPGPPAAKQTGFDLPTGGYAELARQNPHQKSGETGSPRGRYEFQAYVGKYAGGDWASTHVVNRQGEITGGALPNLCYAMYTWSGGKVQASTVPQPLNLASNEIFEVRPPFIYLSGTRDFVLTNAEVENLRKYLLTGGAIWGDSSLPGRNSRFDIAFRREMQRVVGDRDRQFSALTPEHAIFTAMRYPMDEAPAGLNFYQEPVYAITLFGEQSVFYTPNDYGDMLRIGLTEDRTIDFGRNAAGGFVAVDTRVWDHRDTYYRNLSVESLEEAYEFSINMVYYLLTRWDRRVASGGR